MSTTVSLHPAIPSDCALGVDVGGTKIAAGVESFPDGIVQARREIPTLPQRGGDAVLTEVERMVSALC